MRVSLGILALGSFITWLFFGELTGLLSRSLPFHELEQESTLELVTTILSAPATWFALLVVALGFGLSRMRASDFVHFRRGPLNSLTESSFGFETVNRSVVRGVYAIAARFSLTQTGELNWNIFGIISALLVVLVVLWLGA